MSDILPFGMVSAPRVTDTKAACVVVHDHLGTSSVHVHTWWNGEGITVSIDAENEVGTRIELSWQEYKAMQVAVTAILNSQESS